MLIDTHAHVNFNAFKEDGKEVIKRAIEEKTWMVLVGAELKTSKRAIEYANLYDKGVYAAVGLHPIHLEHTEVEEKGEKKESYKFMTKGENFSYDHYYKLANFDKVVAIGEIGLDYYHINLDSDIVSIKERQKEAFWQQLLLAKDLDLPVIIHCRQAHHDLLEILTKFKKEYKDYLQEKKYWGVIHCFSGDEDLAWQYFNLGLMISFTGLITFSKQWESLIRKVSINKIMIETDTPFMTPEPHRGKRNEPLLVYYVAEKIAQIKNIKTEEVAEITSKNAIDFFSLD